MVVPFAVAVALFKYRLYDIDRLINRTLVYGLLTALLGSIYAWSSGKCSAESPTIRRAGR